MMKESYSIYMDNRVKKLLFQATHRGTREGDLVLGHFVRKYLQELTEQDIQELEEILDLSDKAIEDLLRAEPTTPFLEKLKRFHDEELSSIIQHPNALGHHINHDRSF